MKTIEEQREDLELLRFALDKMGVSEEKYQIDPDNSLGADRLSGSADAGGFRASNEHVLCLMPGPDGPWTVLWRLGDGVRGRAVHDSTYGAISDFYWRLVKRDTVWDFCDQWNATGRISSSYAGTLDLDPFDAAEADTISLLEFALEQRSVSRLAFQVGREGNAVTLFDGYCLFNQRDGRWETFHSERGKILWKAMFDDVGDAAAYSYWISVDGGLEHENTPWKFREQWRALTGRG